MSKKRNQSSSPFFPRKNYNRADKNLKKTHQIDLLLISNDQIGVSIPFDIYDKSKKDIIKAHKGTWDHQNKIWIFDSKQQSQLINELKTNFPDVVINQIPELAYRALTDIKNQLEIKKNKKEIQKILVYPQYQTKFEPTSLTFYQKLYDFQKQTIKFGIKHFGRILLGDQMGVGKTIQSLGLAYIYKKDWPLLIICPSSLKFNWQDEILRWYKQIKQYQVQIFSKNGSSVKSKTKILIISYQLATKNIDILQKFNTVIADQAHYLKSLDSKRSGALVPFLKQRKRIILLTGTPAFAKPKQLFNLLSIIRPDVYFNFKQFGIRYCDPKKSPWSNTIQYDGSKNSRQLFYLIKNRIMIRRLKKDVLSELPQKQRQKIIIQTDHKITKQINQIMSSFSMDNLDQFFNKQSDSSFVKAYMLTAQAKLNSVKIYVKQLLQNGVKILIFAHHYIMLDQLQTCMKDNKVSYIRIDGSVSSQQRHNRVKEFQQKQSIKAAILSVTAAGVGLTLTASSTVVFAELHYTPGIMIQAQDRAHRIGQPSSVNCHYLIGQCTLDDIMYKKLESKFNTVSKMIDNQVSTLQVQHLNRGQLGKISKSNYQYQVKVQKVQGYRRLSDFFLKKVPNESLESVKTDISANKQCLQQQSLINNDDLEQDLSYNSDQQLTKLLSIKRKAQQAQQQLKFKNKKIIP